MKQSLIVYCGCVIACCCNAAPLRTDDSYISSLYFRSFHLAPLKDSRCGPGEVRIRLVHVHKDIEPRPLPSPKAIVVDIVGRIGDRAEVLMDDDHQGYRWKRSTLSAQQFRALVGVALSEDFLSIKPPRPIATRDYEFTVEVATETVYHCVATHWITVDTEKRGLGQFRHIAGEILKVAGIPDDQIFWGPEDEDREKGAHQSPQPASGLAPGRG